MQIDTEQQIMSTAALKSLLITVNIVLFSSYETTLMQLKVTFLFFWFFFLLSKKMLLIAK